MNAILPARELSDWMTSIIAGDTYSLLLAVAYTAISSVLTGAQEATFSIVGYGTKDVTKLKHDFETQGYYVTQSGTDVTINWGQRTYPTAY
jgi:hypothetical protein